MACKGGRSRGGRSGGLEHSLAILGFDGVADLTNASNTEAVRERVRKANPEAQAAKIRNVASQLNAFALRMHEGDVVVLPLKTRQGQIALGRVDGPYRYQDVEGVKRHTRSIRWIRPGVPRQEFEQDLLYSLGAFMTVAAFSDTVPSNALQQCWKEGLIQAMVDCRMKPVTRKVMKNLTVTRIRRRTFRNSLDSRYLNTFGRISLDMNSRAWWSQFFRPRVTLRCAHLRVATEALIFLPGAARSDSMVRGFVYR